MDFQNVIGQEHIKKHLQVCYNNNRMPHAQLFVGENGYGTLAMALATANLILNTNPDKQIYSSVLQHPDFHIAVPVNSNKSGDKPTTSDFIKPWQELAKENPYMDLQSWYAKIGIEKKKGIMSVYEAQRIAQELALKSHSGIAKVMVIWCADKLNTQAANRLLKIIEEPPSKTFLILTTEKEELIIDTIKSRCQSLYFSRLNQDLIRSALVENYNIESSTAAFIAQQADGNFAKAISLIRDDEELLEFEDWFISWVRLAFQAKKNKQVVQNLIDWSHTIADNSRDKQIRFLQFCLQFFRQALLKNYRVEELVFLKTKTVFSLEKFAPFVHGKNIEQIQDTIQEAIYHIDRNVNSKMVISDISLKLSRYIHMTA